MPSTITKSYPVSHCAIVSKKTQPLKQQISKMFTPAVTYTRYSYVIGSTTDVLKWYTLGVHTAKAILLQLYLVNYF